MDEAIPPQRAKFWADACACAAHNFADMAKHGMTLGKHGLFIRRGWCNACEHHAILHLICFVLLDTSERVVIPALPNMVVMLRDIYLKQVRLRLTGLPPRCLPLFLERRIHLFLLQQKTPWDPTKRLTVYHAQKILEGNGCQCPYPWTSENQMDIDPCDDCESAKEMLLRLGFIVRDDVLHKEWWMMGSWENISGQVEDYDAPHVESFSEPTDESKTVLEKDLA
jgi:hypothetical protein